MAHLEIDFQAIRDAVIVYQPLLSVRIDLTNAEFGVGDTYTLCSSCTLRLRLSLILEATNPENYYTINTDSNPTYDVECAELDGSNIELYPKNGIVPGRMLERNIDNMYAVIFYGLGSG